MLRYEVKTPVEVCRFFNSTLIWDEFHLAPWKWNTAGEKVIESCCQDGQFQVQINELWSGIVGKNQIRCSCCTDLYRCRQQRWILGAFVDSLVDLPSAASAQEVLRLWTASQQGPSETVIEPACTVQWSVAISLPRPGLMVNGLHTSVGVQSLFLATEGSRASC